MTNGTASNKAAKIANLTLIAVVLAVAAFGFAPVVAECLWGHLRAGIDIANAGHALTRDPYSYMSDMAWVDHEWLFEMILGRCYQTGGMVAVAALKLFLTLSVIAALTWHLLRSKLPPLLVAGLTMIAMALLSPALFAPRPHLFSLLFFCITLTSLMAAESGSRRWLMAIPLVLIPWCNIHGGFVSGLGIVTVWCLADLSSMVWEKRSLTALKNREAATDIAMLVTSYAATLVNPYGVELLTFLGKTLSVRRPEFADWNPLNLGSSLGICYLLLLAVCALIMWRSPRKKSLPSLAVLAIVAIQPFAAMRHYSFGVLTLFMIAAPHLEALREKYAPKFADFSAWSTPSCSIIAVTCAIATIGLLAVTPSRLTQTKIVDTLPVQAVSLLKNIGFTGNLAAPFDSADFCLWHLYPKVRTSIDWRRETAFSDKIQVKNLAFTYGTGRWDQLIEDYPTDAVLVSKNYAPYVLLKESKKWRLCYEDDHYAIFAHPGSAVERSLSSGRAKPELPLF